MIIKCKLTILSASNRPRNDSRIALCVKAHSLSISFLMKMAVRTRSLNYYFFYVLLISTVSGDESSPATAASVTPTKVLTLKTLDIKNAASNVSSLPCGFYPRSSLFLSSYITRMKWEPSHLCQPHCLRL